MDNLELLRFNLQERQYPYFTVDELNILLETSENDVNKASYQGCMMKAQSDDTIDLGSIAMSSNKEYWTSLAKTFRKPGAYAASMKRADES
ncbi:MAG: hypothetical protein AB6733_00245 [Clostridiaceae bacterium]